jgi:NTP pyrophosphatase (non-canonical NTP hydrolase)
MKLKEIAKESKEIGDRIGLNLDAVLHKLTQETGEFNDAIQKYRGIFCKKRSENLNDVKDEYGDVLFNLVYLGYLLGIDVDKMPEYAENTLKKFREREELYKQNIK